MSWWYSMVLLVLFVKYRNFSGLPACCKNRPGRVPGKWCDLKASLNMCIRHMFSLQMEIKYRLSTNMQLNFQICFPVNKIFSCDKGLICNRTSGKTYEVATQSIYGYFVCIKMCYNMQYTHLKIACENTVVLSDCLTLLFKAIPPPSMHEELSMNIKLLFLCEW